MFKRSSGTRYGNSGRLDVNKLISHSGASIGAYWMVLRLGFIFLVRATDFVYPLYL